MLFPRYIPSAAKAAKIIGNAIKVAEEALTDGRIEQEPAMTDRMLGGIEQALQNVRIGGITWRAKTLTDRGRHAQEARIGADFLGVLDVEVPGYFVQKGFLAQAKMVGHRGIGNKPNLIRQCKAMLNLSPASFVFLYTKRGVKVAPAIALVAASGELSAVHLEDPERFFRNHLLCMFGDRAISSPTPAGLDEFVRFANARSNLSIKATAPFIY